MISFRPWRHISIVTRVGSSKLTSRPSTWRKSSLNALNYIYYMLWPLQSPDLSVIKVILKQHFKPWFASSSSKYFFLKWMILIVSPFVNPSVHMIHLHVCSMWEPNLLLGHDDVLGCICAEMSKGFTNFQAPVYIKGSSRRCLSFVTVSLFSALGKSSEQRTFFVPLTSRPRTNERLWGNELNYTVYNVSDNRNF